MPAPLDNQNAAKADADRADSNIHAKCSREDKGLFNLAAQDWAEKNNVNDKRGPFTMWMLTVLQAAVPQHVRDLLKAKQDEHERKRISKLKP